jgi:hypothetical protein
MAFIQYIEKNIRQDALDLIVLCNAIIDNYKTQGYRLTLRQLYYQLVARDLIPNKEQSYKRIGNIVNDARLGGYMDWDAIEDRTRHLRGFVTYDGIDEFIMRNIQRYNTDLWEDQRFRPEIWVEKDALVDIVGRAAEKYHLDYFSCRGYTSQTAIHKAALRLKDYMGLGQIPVIIHLGDHDPSGIDMSRDIRERLELFGVDKLVFERIALNMDQIEMYSPPPNPAKLTDSRVGQYISNYGSNSWELDALNPNVLENIITSKISEYCEDGPYQRRLAEFNSDREHLNQLSDRWDEVEELFESYER